MATRSSRSRRKSGLSIPDLSKVEGRVLVPENEYPVEVLEVTEEEGDKAPYLKWVFGVINDKKYDGAKLYYNTSLAENSLWNLKSLLEALQVEIPDEAFDLDPEEVTGKTMMVSVEHDTYQGKKKAQIVDFWEDEEPEPARGGRGKPKRGGRGGKEEPADDSLTQDALNDMSQDELEDVIKEHKLRVDLADFNTLRKMRAAVIDAAEKKGILAE